MKRKEEERHLTELQTDVTTFVRKERECFKKRSKMGLLQRTDPES